MKKAIAIVSSIIVLALLAFIILSPKKPETVIEATDTIQQEKAIEINEEEKKDYITYKLEKNSQIEWLNKKTWGQHNGTLNISEGNLKLKNGEIQTSTITLDMNSIVATDIDSPKLNEHLKSEEYFDSTNHPEASFKILNIGEKTMKGELTIKGINKTIEVPATVSITEEKITASSSFNLDRTLWTVSGGLPAVSKYMELSFDLTRIKE